MGEETKRILVTGGAGYVGSILIPLLLNRGYKVRAVDFLMFGGEGLLGVAGCENFELLAADLRDKTVIDLALKDIDAVIHLAALVGEEACNFNPEATKDINYQVTKNLADASKKHQVERFIFASTCSSYGRGGDETEVNETRSLDSTTLYTETKMDSENLLLSSNYSSINPCILRFAMMFGLSPKFRFNLIVNDFTREAVMKKCVTVYSPESWRAFTHVRDAAEFYLKCLEVPLDKISNQIFNASSENFQKKQITDLIKNYLPKTKVKVVEKGLDPRSYRVSNSKIVRALGYTPKHTVESGFLEIKAALENGLFVDPYDRKYDIWFNEELLETM